MLLFESRTLERHGRAMRDLFLSGRIIDLILGLIVFEAVCLLTWRREREPYAARLPLLISLVPGIFLLIAVRAAIVAAWWGWIAIALAAAGLTHAADLLLRLRKS